jgi:hypothetical protein
MTDLFFAKITLAERIWAYRCMIDPILGKKLATRSAFPLFHAVPNSSARSRVIFPLMRSSREAYF